MSQSIKTKREQSSLVHPNLTSNSQVTFGRLLYFFIPLSRLLLFRFLRHSTFWRLFQVIRTLDEKPAAYSHTNAFGKISLNVLQECVGRRSGDPGYGKSSIVGSRFVLIPLPLENVNRSQQRTHPPNVWLAWNVNVRNGNIQILSRRQSESFVTFQNGRIVSAGLDFDARIKRIRFVGFGSIFDVLFEIRQRIQWFRFSCREFRIRRLDAAM